MIETSKVEKIKIKSSKLVLIVFLHIVAFGFCDYGDPEASLRAIRLLHTKVLGDKALVVSKLLFIIL